MTGVDTEILRRVVGALVQDCPDSARVVVADQLARSTLLADNLRVKSKVHPKYKTKYHGGNWPEYEQALVRRGDVPLWLSAEAMDAWRPAPSGRPGGPRKFSDVSIMTALMLRLVFRWPLRQTEGFLRSVLALMRTDLEAPDHTTAQRIGAAGKAVIYQWEARKRQPSPVFWTRIDQLRADAAGREARDAAPRP